MKSSAQRLLRFSGSQGTYKASIAHHNMAVAMLCYNNMLMIGFNTLRFYLIFLKALILNHIFAISFCKGYHVTNKFPF